MCLFFYSLGHLIHNVGQTRIFSWRTERRNVVWWDHKVFQPRVFISVISDIYIDTSSLYRKWLPEVLCIVLFDNIMILNQWRIKSHSPSARICVFTSEATLRRSRLVTFSMTSPLYLLAFNSTKWPFHARLHVNLCDTLIRGHQRFCFSPPLLPLLIRTKSSWSFLP